MEVNRYHLYQHRGILKIRRLSEWVIIPPLTLVCIMISDVTIIAILLRLTRTKNVFKSRAFILIMPISLTLDTPNIGSLILHCWLILAFNRVQMQILHLLKQHLHLVPLSISN